MPMYWTFNCFLNLPFSPQVTFKSWILTSEKKGPSCPNWGQGGGFRWFGQCPKESVFFALMSYLKWINSKQIKTWWLSLIDILREGLNGKKTFSFGHCPNHLNPPPWPQFRQLGPLFWTSKTTFCAYDRHFFFDDDNDGFNDNYDKND